LLAPGLSAGPGLPIAAAALLVGMRPEGALFALALGAAHFLRARALGAPRGPALAGLAAAVVGLAGLSLLRLAVFGELVPNTWFAKVAGAGTLVLGLGFAYLVDWLLANAAFALAVAAAAAVCAASLLRRRADLGSPLAVLLGLAVVFAAYVVRAGGDNTSAFPYWRHLLHAAPLLAFLAATGLVGVAPRSRTLRAALAAALVATSTASTLGVHGDRLRREVREDLRRFPHLAHRPPSAYDRWLARLASPDTVIASSAAGEMPFVVDAVHLDMLGLNDRHIAHEGRFDPRGPVDSKSDPAYVLGRRPDVLQLPVVVSKILEAEGDRAPVLRRGQMSWAIVRDPRFRDEYLLVRNAPYSHRDVALFVRRGWWQTHPRKDELQVVPFAETGLYRRWIAGGSGGDVTDPRRPR
jgi:hypothetical protein